MLQTTPLRFLDTVASQYCCHYHPWDLRSGNAASSTLPPPPAPGRDFCHISYSTYFLTQISGLWLKVGPSSPFKGSSTSIHRRMVRPQDSAKTNTPQCWVNWVPKVWVIHSKCGEQQEAQSSSFSSYFQRLLQVISKGSESLRDPLVLPSLSPYPMLPDLSFQTPIHLPNIF